MLGIGSQGQLSQSFRDSHLSSQAPMSYGDLAVTVGSPHSTPEYFSVSHRHARNSSFRRIEVSERLNTTDNCS